MANKKAKVEFEYPIRVIHGKPCSHSTTYFAVNGFTGKPYIAKICNPSTNVTAGMLAQRQLFKAASDYAKSQMWDASKRAAAEMRFNTQSKYKMLRTFLMAESMSGNEVA